MACTQVRRVAAIAAAERVANEMEVPLGDVVGYHVRFDRMVSEKTRLGFVTEGSLVMSLLGNPILSDYVCYDPFSVMASTDISRHASSSTMPMRGLSTPTSLCLP